jgi:tRNA1(Val) A37 N6-methylase TrmN6
VSAASTLGEAGYSRDAFLGGKVLLIQPRRGHRAGLDAALLQALVPAEATGHAIELGAGVGSVAFAVGARAPGLRIIGIERDSGLVGCGAEALSLPGNAAFAERVTLIAGDVAAPKTWLGRAGLAQGEADWVLMNPPFDEEGHGTHSPDPFRDAAYVAPRGLLDAWVGTAAAILKPGGTLGMIHRPSALPEIVASLVPKFGGLRIRAVHPNAGAEAGRVLVTARLGRRTPLALLPPLVLHEAGGAWTGAADAILRGEAELGP